MAQTILIVDDHQGFRRFARRLLEAGGLTVVGEAATAASAIAAARELAPDLVLLDVMLPDGDGFAVAEEIAQAVVLMSSHAQDDLSARLARSSAVGFIRKDDLSTTALLAVGTS